jgi:hypothetical protein
VSPFAGALEVIASEKVVYEKSYTLANGPTCVLVRATRKRVGECYAADLQELFLTYYNELLPTSPRRNRRNSNCTEGKTGRT